MMRVILCLFLLTALCGGKVLAQDPETMRERANGQVMAASRLMNKGLSLMQRNPTASNRRTAMELLIEAGQMFEQAAGIYEALGPEYASTQDVENSRNAMRTCIEMIEQIKQTF